MYLYNFEKTCAALAKFVSMCAFNPVVLLMGNPKNVACVGGLMFVLCILYDLGKFSKEGRY